MTASTSLSAPAVAYDPALTSLFASSAGPVQAPSRRPSDLKQDNGIIPAANEPTSDSESGPASEFGGSSASSTPKSTVNEVNHDRPRKRRRSEDDDLETSYFRRLAEEARREHHQEHHHHHPGNSQSGAGETVSEDDTPDHQLSIDVPPIHESLTTQDVAADKAKRTVFLSNVSVAAIKSAASKRVLLNHLQSVFGASESHEKKRIESFRFRSTAFVADAGPKRAAFAKKELMEQTSHNTNAYVVFATEQDAAEVISKLNGSVVLDRHLRLDSVANPGRIDQRRCVFVGNLPFVDEENNAEQHGIQEDKPRRPKAKQPADTEEGLWRAFSKVGKVENVRVVKDKETRVGKGFAYVQFANENGVEAALLLDGKKFPPMLPRLLRVSRAKASRHPHRPIMLPRRGRDVVRKRQFLTGANSERKRPRRSSDLRSSEGTVLARPANFVFEGHRATSSDQTPGRARKRATKPNHRSARRGAAFKSSGGKKKRDKR